VFERFEDGARRTVVIAQEEARRLGHGWIGPEHLLLALLHDEIDVGGALRSVDRDAVVALLPAASTNPVGHVPFTPEAKAALEWSLRESLDLGHDHIGPGHLLLALVHDTAAPAAVVLASLDVDVAALRSEVRDHLGGSPAPRRPMSAGPITDAFNRLAELEWRVNALEERVRQLEDRGS
jgi:ATP-dependent Clp protease ATP-binding subunit ClpC